MEILLQKHLLLSLVVLQPLALSAAISNSGAQDTQVQVFIRACLMGENVEEGALSLNRDHNKELQWKLKP